jgi:uncharacterized protein YbaR (Trm112 family)/SAM-dependent methyltransferase
MKSYLLQHIQCIECSHKLAYDEAAQRLTCESCGRTYKTQDGIPLFTPPPAGLVPSQKLERGPEMGTPWRKANWRFIEKQISRLEAEAAILDVGAGRGDFAAALKGRKSLAVEIYPYPEVDIVCDLTQVNPFCPGSFDAILLLNVMEHVYDTHTLLATLSDLLKPGGALLVAIPFMVKMHQVPVDYVRYTHYALERLGADHGLDAEEIEGYYDPVFFLGEGIGNLRNAILPTLQGSRRYFGRLLIAGIQVFASILGRVTGPGKAQPPAGVRSLAPTGYQIVYRKQGPALSNKPLNHTES